MENNSEKRLRVALVGAYPPPTGGSSVHIKRLRRMLLDAGHEVIVIDFYSKRSEERTQQLIFGLAPLGIFSLLEYRCLLREFNVNVVHTHISAMRRFIYIGRILSILSPRRARQCVTIHSGSFPSFFTSLSRVKQFLVVSMLKSFDSIITVGKEQRDMLAARGINESSMHVIPAYLPPGTEQFSEVDKIMELAHAQNKKVIVSSGYGLPLYGYEKLIAAIDCDPELWQQLLLVVCLYNTYDEEYVSEIRETMDARGQNVIFRDLSSEQFAYLLERSDVYVRGTDRDGDAVAIREANFFGLQVVASDVVKRPEYCILFDRDDAAAFSGALRRSLVETSLAENWGDNFKKLECLYASCQKTFLIKFR